MKSKILKLLNSSRSAIFVKSLKKATTVSSIREVFSVYGKVRYVQLSYNKKKKRNIGYGFVVFKDVNMARYLVDHVKFADIDGKLIKIWPFVQDQFSQNCKIDGVATTNVLTDVPNQHIEQLVNSCTTNNFETHGNNGNYYNRTDTSAGAFNAVSSKTHLTIRSVYLHSLKPTRRSFYVQQLRKFEHIIGANVVLRIQVRK